MKIIMGHATLDALFAKADANPAVVAHCIVCVEPEMHLYLHKQKDHYAHGFVPYGPQQKYVHRWISRGLSYPIDLLRDREEIEQIIAVQMLRLAQGDL